MHYNKILIIFFLLLPVFLNTLPVAIVDQKEISYEQLSAAMEELEKSTDLTYSQIREQALENLIEENLILIYAEKHNITVDEMELDSFFMNHLGDHPRFLTEGFFDRAKYLDFKNTETGKLILQEMEKEILLSKTRTVLIDSFQLTDQLLYKEFLLRNAQIDISYSIVDVALADVNSDYTYVDAIDFFRRNRKKFRTEELVKMEFLLIPFSNYELVAENYLKLKEQELFTADSILTESNIDSLRNSIKTEKMIELAYREAEKVRFKLEIEQPVQYPLLETGYIGINEQYGQLPQEVIYQAFNLENMTFSAPFELDIGYLIFRVIDRKYPREKSLSEAPEEIWQAYLEATQQKQYSDQFRDYFYSHIDEFIIPVAVVEKIEIPDYGLFKKLKDKAEQEDLIRALNRNAKNDYRFNRILEDYDLSKRTDVIYLEKFTNTTTVSEVIANRIRRSDNYGLISLEERSWFYRLNSYFPEYIPDYRDIQSQFSGFESISEDDSTAYQEFYHNYKKDFQTPDSLQLGGLYFPVITDSIEIDSNKVYQYYFDNINNYYRGKAVEFDCIYVRDSTTAQRVRDYAVSGIDFHILKFFYNRSNPFAVNVLVPENELPRAVASLLFETRDAAISFPIAYQDGWLIFQKIRSFKEGLRDLNDVYQEIAYKFQYEIADSLAELHARMVFDSTRYYSHSFRFKKYGELFKTAYQNADDEFEILGFLKDEKQDLLRLWKNEKYSSIYPVEAGYAVVFQLQKRSARQLEYEQALPEIKNIFSAKAKMKRAKAYLNSLKQKIIAGSDPDSLFFFLGGWQTANNINLESNLFGPEYSKLILNDIVEKEEDYFSPVLTLSENTLFLYRIDRLDMVSRQDFEAQKEQFRSEFVEEKFQDWLKQFRTNFQILINF